MNASGIARVRACFENAEVIPPLAVPERFQVPSQGSSLGSLPQVPQPTDSAPRVTTGQEDVFEERAAIIQYDGGLPRLLAEFLARGDTGR